MVANCMKVIGNLMLDVAMVFGTMMMVAIGKVFGQKEGRLGKVI